MKAEHRLLAPIVAYHGCDARVAERVFAGSEGLRPSENDYDWLGPGVYFWVGSPERALDWAREQRTRGKLGAPAVVGALIHPARCLNLTDYGALGEVKSAYDHLELREDAGAPPYDAVLGVFEEDEPLYPGAGFKRRTHIQVAVRDLEIVIGYFRPM